MHKLLIFIALAATLALSGCSSFRDVTDAVPDALDRAPLIYRPVIQQGNVVTQEQVNQLEIGMSRRQVQFLLGSPMLSDVFHANRWDYAYTWGIGSKPSEMSRVTVHFEDERLSKIEGDLQPQPEEQRTEPKREVVVTVPDWEPTDKSLIERTLDTIGLDDD